ncbi:tyrosine-type recombinase/integrase [Candidatus Latescibacterota bacterium]
MGRLKSKELLKIYKLSSSPCWWVRFTDESGKEVRKSTGYRREEYTKDMVQRIINVESGDSASNVFTIAWMENYILELLEMEERAERTIISYETSFKILKEIYGEAFNIRKLARGCVVEIQKHLHKKGMGNSSINHYVSMIKSAFERLVIEDKIQVNPFYRFKKLPSKTKIKSLTKDDAKKFLKHVNNLKNEKLRHLIRILVYTGIRRTELLGIERDDVDLDNMTFKAVNCKSKDLHKVKRKFGEEIWNDFRYFLEASRSDFPFKVITPNYFSNAVKKCMTDCSLPENLHLHSLRHTFITFAIESGTPIRAIQQYVDHASIAMTEGYAHDKSDMLPHIDIE